MPPANRDLLINLQLKLDNAKREAQQFAQQVNQTFKQQGNSAVFQEQSKQLAAMRVSMREIAQEQTQLNRSIAQETAERERAYRLAVRESELAKSRQSQAFSQAGNTLAGALPGGGILAPGAGISGNLALAGAAAAAGAIALFGHKLNEIGSQAEALTKNFSDMGGPLDQLRASTLKLKESQDRLAASPAAARFQSFQNDVKAGVNDFFGRILNAVDDTGEKLFSGKKADQVDRDRWQAEQQNKNPLSLAGDLKLQFDEMNHAEQVANQQLGMQKLQIEHDIVQKRIQFAMDVKDAELSASRDRYQIELDQARELQDYQYNKAKTLADFEGKQAEQRFQQERAFAMAQFTMERKNAQDNLALKQKYDNTTFGNTLADKQLAYGVEQGRANRSFRDQVWDLSMTGGNGLQYMQAIRSFRENYSDRLQDYNIDRAKSIRDFGLGRQRENEEFALSNRQATQAFGLQNAQAYANRALEVQAHQYQMAQELTVMEREHSRALQDSTHKLQVWSENLAITMQKLGIRAADESFQNQQTVAGFNLSAAEQSRQFSLAKGAFAASIFDQNSAIFSRLALSNPDLEMWLNQQRARRNEPGYVNPLRLPNTSPSQVAPPEILPQDQPGSDAYGYNYGGGGYSPTTPPPPPPPNPYAYGTFQYSQQQKPIQIIFQGGNPTFPTIGGASQADIEQLQRQYAQDLTKLQSEYAELVKVAARGY